MSDLRQSFNFVTNTNQWPGPTPETGGTNNADGSNADDSNYSKTNCPAPWHTVVRKYSWEVSGHSTHKIIYNPFWTAGDGSANGWMYEDAIGTGGISGWNLTASNGVITFNSGGFTISFNESAPWVSGTAPTGSGTTAISRPITAGAWSGMSFTPDDVAPATGKYQWDMDNQKTGSALHQLEYIPTVGWFCMNVDGTCFGDVTATSETSGSYVNATGGTTTFTASSNQNLASTSNGVVTITHVNGGNMTFNEVDMFTNGLPTSGSGSGSGSGGGPNTLSGGSSPEIKDITFTNASDTIVYLAFNWQNVSTAYLFVDRGGTVTQTNISLGGLGQSGSVGSSGFLTNMQDGDKVWIANTELVNDPYIHRFIDWSYDKATGKVIAKAFFIDDGGNGFNQNADVALARIMGATFYHGYSLYDAQQDPTGGYTDHDGTLKTLTLDAPPGSRWAIARGNTHQYGTGFKVPSANRKVFCNFW